MSTTSSNNGHGDLLFYATDDGKTRIDVLFDKENAWLTQKRMAELFECSTDNISLHLKNIFKERELHENSVTEEYSTTALDGKRYNVKHYSLEAIIAVGYRVNTIRGTQFRQWATARLRDYILKGFTIDTERFMHGSRFDTRYFEALLEEIREIRASERLSYQKITDIYATAADYSPDSVDAERFFAKVQNKLHFAITGRTAAEIITERANSTKPFMGLTTWRKAPGGKILKSDVGIAKNYLRKEEIELLNRIVTMYIDYAELQASRGKLMRMREWSEKLDAFLRFNEREILQDTGKVSHTVALALAEEEYASFRKSQDASYLSDFDHEMKRIQFMRKQS